MSQDLFGARRSGPRSGGRIYALVQVAAALCVCLAGTSSCRRLADKIHKRHARTTAAGRPGPASPPPAPARWPAVQLPELASPLPRPAERVVHLLFTSNADGELAPCG